MWTVPADRKIPWVWDRASIPGCGGLVERAAGRCDPDGILWGDARGWIVSIGDRTLRELLARWDERMRSDQLPGLELPAEARARGSVLRDPASEAEIAAAEARLGTRLPASYRRFLAISNGAFANSAGPADETHPQGGFLPVDQVQWAALADAFFVDLWTGLEGLNDPERGYPRPGVEPVEVEYYAPLDRGLLISGNRDAYVDVLVPVGSEEEWQVWSFHWDGATAHRSLPDLLRWQLARPPEIPPTSAEIDEMIERIRQGELALMWRLEGTADPRLFDLAIEVLSSPHLDLALAARISRDRAPTENDYRLAHRERILRAAPVLGFLGRREAIESLREAYANAPTSDARMNALNAMIKCGAPDAEHHLLEMVHATDPQERRWALAMLSQRDPVDLDLYRTAMDDEQWIVRHGAIHALLRHNPPDIVPLLRKALRDQQSRRWLLPELVNRLPDDASIATLEGATMDPDLETRRWAIGELVERRAPGSLDSLKALARDETGDDATRSLRRWARRRLEQPDLAGRA